MAIPSKFRVIARSEATWRPEREARGSTLGVQSPKVSVSPLIRGFPRPLRGLGMTANFVNNNLPQKGHFMFCTIIDIRGDYAYVKYDDTGIVSDVAIALLPFGVDVGDRLIFENYEFSRA